MIEKHKYQLIVNRALKGALFMLLLLATSVKSQATYFEGVDWTKTASVMKNPKHWYQADDFVASGQSWTDRGSQGNHMTSYYGTITKVDSHSETGKSSVNFANDGSNNPYIESQSNSYFEGHYNRPTWIVVAKVESVPGQIETCLLSQGRNSSVRDFCVGFANRERMLISTWAKGCQSTSNIRQDTFAVYTYTVHQDWHHFYNGFNSYFYVNNVLFAPQQWVSSWGSAYLDADKRRFGSFESTGTARQFTGDIAEVLEFNPKLSTADRQHVNDRLCSKYVCKDLVLSWSTAWTTAQQQDIWAYETSATARANVVYTHPEATRNTGHACCRMEYRAFMKDSAGAISIIEETYRATPIAYNRGNRQITFKTDMALTVTTVYTIVVRARIIGNDVFNLDQEVTWTINMREAVDSTIASWKLPVYRYVASDYDGTLTWTDSGTEGNDMTRRNVGYATKQLASNGANFYTVNFLNNGNYNPYFEQLNTSVLMGFPEMTVIVFAKYTNNVAYNCLFAQGQDTNYHEMCFGSFSGRMGTGIWTNQGGRYTSSNTDQVVDDFAIYSFNTKGSWSESRTSLKVRVDMVEKATQSYGTTPQYINEDYARLGSWKYNDGNMRFNGEIAEILIWNESLSDAAVEAEEQILKNKYVCARTDWAWTATLPVLETAQVCELPDDQEEATCTYTFPEVSPTISGCPIYYKAYLESNTYDVFTDTSTPIALINTTEDPRKLSFTVDRNMAQQTLIFMIESYIPDLTQEGLFVKQLSLFVDGKVRELVTALSAASFQSELTEIEMTQDGSRLYQISEFVCEPDLGLTVTYSMEDVGGVNFDTVTLQVTVDGDEADKGEPIEIEIKGTVQNVDGAGAAIGDEIETSATYTLSFSSSDAATAETTEDTTEADSTGETTAETTEEAAQIDETTADEGDSSSVDTESATRLEGEGSSDSTTGSAVYPDEEEKDDESEESLPEIVSLEALLEEVSALEDKSTGGQSDGPRIVPTVSAKLISEDTVDIIPPIRINQKDLKKYAKLKREKLGKAPKGPKLAVEQPKLSENGEMAMNFSKPIVVFGGGKMPGKESLVMKMVSSDSLDADNDGRRLDEIDRDAPEDQNSMTFEVTEFTEEGMKINIDFSKPMEVSSRNGSSDKLKISLAKDTFFAQGSYEAISGELDLDVTIPKQFDSPEEAAKTRGIAQGIKAISYSIIGVCFLIQLVWSGSLENIWPMFNALQLLTILTVLNLEMPTNAHLVLSEIRKILEVEELREQIYQIVTSKPIYYWTDMENLIIVFIIPTVAAVTIFVILYFKAKKYESFQKITAWIEKRIFWSVFIRLIFMTYLNVLVAANVGSLFQRDDFTFNVPAVFYVALVAQAAGGYLYFTEVEELETPASRLSFGTIYQNLKTDEQSHALLMPFIFFFRRLVFIIFMRTDIFAIKFGGMILCVMGQLIFMYNVKPFISKSLGALEFFNETILLLCSYMLPSFTGLIPDPIDNYKFGWVFVCILIPFFIVNILFLITSIVRLSMRAYADRKARLAWEQSDEGKRQLKVDKMFEKKGDWKEIKSKPVLNPLSHKERVQKEMKAQEEFFEKSIKLDRAQQRERSRQERDAKSNLKIGSALNRMKTNRSKHSTDLHIDNISEISNHHKAQLKRRRTVN